MKWIAHGLAIAFVSVWQITCWTSPGFWFYAVSWPITLVACLMLEGVLFAVQLRTELDREGRMNRRVARALYAFALILPVFPYWVHVLVVLGSITAFRLCRTGWLRHAVPTSLAAAATAWGATLAPWRADPHEGGLLGWSAMVTGAFLFSYELWLLLSPRAATRSSQDAPSARSSPDEGRQVQP